jgi:pteridine reductase
MTRILDSVPLHRPAGVEEIADAVEFFWKNPSLTGVILPVDGGKHLNN